MRAAARGALAILVGLVAACGGGAPTPAPRPDTPIVVAPPDDWAWTASSDGGLRVALPPWLVAFDTQGAVFANEPPPGQGLQLLAQGPRAGDQPPSNDVELWLRERTFSPIEGFADVEHVDLPAGSGLHIERLDGAGTPQAWQLEAWAIETPDGVGYLQIDGPPAAWNDRHEDVARIAALVRYDDPSPERQAGGSQP